MGEVINFAPRPDRQPATMGNLALQTISIDGGDVQRPQRRRYLQAVKNNELSQIQNLQDQWDGALGIKREAGEFENYNPVLARWGFERLKTDEQREMFRAYELQNVKTALRERNHTSESRLDLSIGSDKKIHNEVFPDSAYEEVLERGIRYRAENGSNEIEREAAEKRGFLKIQEALTTDEVEVGTTFFVVSGPGFAKDTPYVHNFVDGYKLAVDENGKRYIQYSRFASPLDYEKYQEIAKGLNPGYFDGQEGSIDAWYLANPIRVPSVSNSKSIDEIFSKHFAKDVKAMEEQKFQEIWKIYLPFVFYYLDQITKQDFDPISIAEAWNSVLLSVEDEGLKREAVRNDIFVSPGDNQLSLNESYRIADMVLRYGRREVKELKAGCGRSGGVSFGKDGITDGSLQSVFAANSVTQFDRYGSRSFSCPSCNKPNLRPEGGFISSCQHCGSVRVACGPSDKDKPARSEKKEAQVRRGVGKFAQTT